MNKLLKSTCYWQSQRTAKLGHKLLMARRRYESLKEKQEQLMKEGKVEFIAWNARVYAKMWLDMQMGPRNNEMIAHAGRFVKFLDWSLEGRVGGRQ
jgi:hypothetical protein